MLTDLLRVSFAPSGATLERFLECKTRRHFIFGPLGSAKTFTCAMKALKLVCDQAPGSDGVRRSTGLVVRTAMTDLETSALKDWLELTEVKFGGALGRFNWASPRKHELRFRLPDKTTVEADIWFLGLDDPDGVIKVRGMPLTWAWLNEARDFSRGLVQMIYGRCGRYPRMEDGGPTWHGLFGDTNMPYVGHWMHEMAETVRPQGWEFMRQPGGVVRSGDEWVLNAQAENLNFLPPGYYEEQMQGADEGFINVYLAANYGFVMDGKPVYRDYNDQLHCKPVKPLLSRPIERGWDFGLTPACVFSQLMPDGRWIVFDELVSEDVGMDADVFSDAVLEHSARHYSGYRFDDAGDPSGADPTQADSTTCFQVLHRKGIKVASPFRVLGSRTTRAKDDLALRLACVSTILRSMPGGRPRFSIDPEAQITRKGLMGGYRFKKMHTKIERYVEKPEKNEYCVDELTRAMTPGGWKRHDELHAGDAIFAFSEGRIVPSTVMAVNRFDGRKEIMRLSNSRSFDLAMTDNHACIASRQAGSGDYEEFGFVRAVDLHTGHRLMARAGSLVASRRDGRMLSDEFTRLAAWVATEGAYCWDGAVSVSQSVSANPLYCSALQDLMAHFNVRAQKTIRTASAMMTWRISGEIAFILKQLMPLKFPGWAMLSMMKPSQMRLFIYEALRGDGHWPGNDPMPTLTKAIPRSRDFWLPGKTTPRLWQADRPSGRGLIESLEAMAVLCGMNCSIHEDSQGRIGVSFLRDTHGAAVSAMSRDRIEVEGVWCPTTEHGTWIAKRGNCAVITGNSHPLNALEYTAVKLFGEIMLREPKEPKIKHKQIPAPSLGAQGWMA